MSSSAALKVLFALAVIWASYETSIALEYASTDKGSSTEETESTQAATTLVTTEDDQQVTTTVEDDSTTDTVLTSTAVPVSEDSSLSTLNGRTSQADEKVKDTKSDVAPTHAQSQGLLMPYESTTENDQKRNETKIDESRFDRSNEEEIYYEDFRTLSPPTFSGYVYQLESSGEGDLQDISGQESKIMNNLYLHFEPKKQKKRKNETKIQPHTPAVQITSYLADSETAIPMTGTEIIKDAENKTRGADMISAFFIAPEDEVNEIDKNKYSGRPIVVSNLNEDLVRNERYTGKEATKTLTNDILAPIQAALSLSHEEEGPVIEKQVLHKEPVYKTYIEIQKSIPYEIKEVEEPKEQQIAMNNDLGLQASGNEVVHHSHYNGEIGQPPILSNELPAYSRAPVSDVRAPVSVYYKYPMYYLPHSYIGNYIMRHSHENTGYNHVPPVRPILPVHYMLARYQPQVYSTFLLTHPYYVTPTETTSPTQQDAGYESDQNGLHAEQRPSYAHAHNPHQYPPFRSSHPVYSSQYPPYTYKVLTTMRNRNARTARSKQLCIEYGGFKPPMVPSTQLDDDELLTDPVKDKTDADDKAAER